MRVRVIRLLMMPLAYPDRFQDASKGAMPSLSARFKKIYQIEGFPALFAGVVPRTMWISAGGAVFLGVYEWAVHSLSRR